jgi:enolase
MRATIASLKARKILDSRGNPTIEVEIGVEAEGRVIIGRAAAPSGASRGKHEVVAFPKGGVDAALGKISEIFSKLSGADVFEQERIDAILREIDGTSDLSELGGNTTVAISMASSKAAALVEGKRLFEYLGGDVCELPYPLGNIVGGGKHAGARAPDIQEFQVVPLGAKRVSETIFANVRVHKRTRELVEKVDKTFTGGKGDEGAWAPNLDNEKTLEILTKACEEVSTEIGVEIRPCLDVAASSLYDEEKDAYVYKREGVERDPGEQLEFVVRLVNTYGLFYVEDPLQEEDFAGFAELVRKVGKKCLICGDDLFVTNVERIRRGMEISAANAVLIKPNQIGTLTDALKAVKLTKEHGCVPVLSHRSGETSDETIAHLATGWGCAMIKTGVVGGERTSKLNELIRIEEVLGEKARMARLPFGPS